jgi:anti-sigma factor RsiW
MSCCSVDLKAYVLGEVDRQEQTACENHLEACSACRQELEQLNLTKAALMSMPDEEIPQRIAFVSDKVFEPKWWQTVWRSGPAMVFASAALLSSAIFVHAFARPAAPAVAPAPVAQIDTGRIEAEVDQRVQAAVAKAIADVEKREDAKTARILATAEKRYESQRQADLAEAQQTISLVKNQLGRMMYAANYPAPRSEP